MMKKEPAQRVGGRHTENCLQRARITAGKTQAQAAEAIDCGLRSLQRYEHRERQPNRRHLEMMQVCYACDFSDLFQENTSLPPYRGEEDWA